VSWYLTVFAAIVDPKGGARMNMEKSGDFLKQLRKEKGLTQEELAEKFLVSGRTVSRWETGRNMPDLSVLAGLATFYEVDIREIIDGERKDDKSDDDMDAAVLKLAQYGNEDKLKLTRRIHLLFGGGVIAALVYMVLVITDRADNFLGGLCMGITFGMMIVGFFMTGKYAAKIREYKLKMLRRNNTM